MTGHYWRNTSLFLIVVFYLLHHQTNAKEISNGAGSHLQFIKSDSPSKDLDDKPLEQRIKRAVESDIQTNSVNNEFTQNVAIAIGIAAVFCLSSFTLLFCIFCNEEDKASDAAGPNGYVGEINLADIQVIYNPSAGAPRLPYTHQNEAFKGSQEDIVFANSAVLQVTSHDNVAVRMPNVHQNRLSDQNPRLLPAEVKQSKESHQNREPRYPYRFEYENPYAQNRLHALNKPTNKNYTSVDNGREYTGASVAVPYNATGHSNRSREFYNANVYSKDYDMNDFTIKNMHIRY